MDHSRPAVPPTQTWLTQKESADPEVHSVKFLLKLMDKAAKSARTYGKANPVAARFFDQFYTELSRHLQTYTRLAFLVQRSELYFKNHLVYQPDRDATGESIAFKMYADGIRELAFYEGLSRDDVIFFLDALWGGLGPDASARDEDDDDIVTRLWARNLTTITVVTAEEIVRSSGYGLEVLEPHVAGLLNAGTSSLREILDRERRRDSKEPMGRGGAAAGGEGAATSEIVRRLQPNVVGYEVSDGESEALLAEIREECGRDGTAYILGVLTTILASERSPALLTKLFEVWGDVTETFFREGQWTALNRVLSLLKDVASIRPDLPAEHCRRVEALLENVGCPEHLQHIETYLNKTPAARTEGLSAFLLSLHTDRVPSLCQLLAHLECPAHQSILSDALCLLARHNPDPLVRGLSDKRPSYVRHLLAVIGKWNDPRLADPVEKTLRHGDAHVRKDALKVLALLRPSGPGAKFVALLHDPEETVRLTAMKLLATGQYTVPFSCWAPFVTGESFQERSSAEKRAVFHAMRCTAGDEAVPFWQALLTDWSWTGRKKKEELAGTAVEALGKLGSPAALAALTLGQRKGTAAVRQACSLALAAAGRTLRAKDPTVAQL